MSSILEFSSSSINCSAVCCSSSPVLYFFCLLAASLSLAIALCLSRSARILQFKQKNYTAIESIADVQWGQEILAKGSNILVWNKACRVSNYSGGPEGWHFPVTTENQWSILFLTCHQENSALFSLNAHTEMLEQNGKI